MIHYDSIYSLFKISLSKSVECLVTGTYLPAISLSANPETLWDEDIGIYENEYKQREIPITIEYFTPENNYQFTVNAGARLGGLNIWTKPQKPFTIYTRDRFGDDYINYQLFNSLFFAFSNSSWEIIPFSFKSFNFDSSSLKLMFW